MTTRWKKWILALSGVLIVFTAIGFLLPQCQTVERHISTTAAPERLFTQLSTLKRWPLWTAWNTNRFPDMTMNFEGSDSGAGAIMKARGKASGNGTVYITRAVMREGVWYDLDFENGTQIFHCAITYSPQENNLVVTWRVEACLGRNPFKRWAGLAVDSLMGGDMETGLRQLIQQAEGAP